MTNDQIRDIALANGFELKEQPDGTMDLNPYVYDVMQKVMLLKLEQVRADMADFIVSKYTLESQSMLDKCDDLIERHIESINTN